MDGRDYEKCVEVFLNHSMKLLNLVTKILVITVKGPEPGNQPPLMLETSMLPQ